MQTLPHNLIPLFGFLCQQLCCCWLKGILGAGSSPGRAGLGSPGRGKISCRIWFESSCQWLYRQLRYETCELYTHTHKGKSCCFNSWQSQEGLRRKWIKVVARVSKVRDCLDLNVPTRFQRVWKECVWKEPEGSVDERLLLLYNV